MLSANKFLISYDYIDCVRQTKTTTAEKSNNLHEHRWNRSQCDSSHKELLKLLSLLRFLKISFQWLKTSLCLFLNRRLVFKGWESLCAWGVHVWSRTKPQSHMELAAGIFSPALHTGLSVLWSDSSAAAPPQIFGLAEQKGSYDANKNTDWIATFTG